MNFDTDKEIVSLFTSSAFWPLNKKLVTILGVECTLLLTDLSLKYNYFKDSGVLDDKGYFYNVGIKIKKDTTINLRTQAKIIDQLVEKGILKVKKFGMYNKKYYKIDFAALKKILKIDKSDLTLLKMTKYFVKNAILYIIIKGIIIK